MNTTKNNNLDNCYQIHCNYMSAIVFFFTFGSIICIVFYSAKIKYNQNKTIISNNKKISTNYL
jgi:hypothetical protein